MQNLQGTDIRLALAVIIIAVAIIFLRRRSLGKKRIQKNKTRKKEVKIFKEQGIGNFIKRKTDTNNKENDCKKTTADKKKEMFRREADDGYRIIEKTIIVHTEESVEFKDEITQQIRREG